MNENQLAVNKKYEVVKPFIHKIDSIIDNCYRDCHDNYFYTFKYDCIYDNNPKYITNNEIIISTVSDKSLGLYDLNKKLRDARQNGFMFNQINKLTMEIYSNHQSIIV